MLKILDFKLITWIIHRVVFALLSPFGGIQERVFARPFRIYPKKLLRKSFLRFQIQTHFFQRVITKSSGIFTYWMA